MALPVSAAERLVTGGAVRGTEQMDGSEIFYAIPYAAPPPDADFAKWPPLQTYWANFAHTGDPNGHALPQWQAFGPSANYIDFTPQGPKAGTDLRAAICRLRSP
jgi:para-nitrobenzyl esterase